MSLASRGLDWNTVAFFLKIGLVQSKSLTRAKREGVWGKRKNVSSQSRSPFSASLQTFCLTVRAYLNTQKIRAVLQSSGSAGWVIALMPAVSSAKQASPQNWPAWRQ